MGKGYMKKGFQEELAYMAMGKPIGACAALNGSMGHYDAYRKMLKRPTTEVAQFQQTGLENKIKSIKKGRATQRNSI